MGKTLSIVLVMVVLASTVACASNDGAEQETSLSTASIPFYRRGMGAPRRQGHVRESVGGELPLGTR